MKQKPRWTLEMFTMGFALLAAALSLLLLVVQPALGPVVLVVAVVCIILVVVSRYRIRRWAARWVTGTSFENSRTQYSLASLSQPAALLSGDTVVWYNLPFRDRVLAGGDQLAGRVNKMLPGLDMAQCAGPDGQVLACVSGTWRIHASTVKGEGEKVSILILNDETALRRVELEYKASRPGYMIFSVDGYDDVFSDMLDSESARLLERINRTIEAMIARGTGFLRRVANGRYIAVVEERQLEQFAQQGYDVLDKIRALEPSINLSISIGIGRRAPTLHEAQEMAVQALDMAQGRGGDQAAEMTPDGFTFYGGVSHGVEKRSKVRSRIVAEALVGLIKAADHVVIMGHRMSDLDAIGSAEGMLRICKICDVPAVIAVKREATLASSLINAIEDAGQEGDFIDPRSALSIISKETLCIVVDTYQVGQVECKEILEKCGKIAVIDHHRKGVGYIENAVLVCHEPYASSASELVTELLQYVGTRDDKPTRIEAEGLLAGIMLDTRNFSLHTGVRTFEAGGGPAPLRRRDRAGLGFVRRQPARIQRQGEPGGQGPDVQGLRRGAERGIARRSAGGGAPGGQRPVEHRRGAGQLCGGAGRQYGQDLGPQHGPGECAGDHGEHGRRRTPDHGGHRPQAHHHGAGPRPPVRGHRRLPGCPEKGQRESLTS